MAEDRLTRALEWLAEQFSVTAEEFRGEHKQGSGALLEALVSHGYANTKGDRYAVSEQGRRRLAHLAPMEESDE